ncbi:MAG: hypothetical protein F6K40_08960 [Okeania sp. SIO3I5]|uniref:hypothetical protein n=1 Tax=Okeania sp. SIO3I5 TaxID=2607805 RepID=UPI0013B83D06|nr:hypothetical protein [Okeania sp. SIO3I5]NEQ36394.1 hypothetical protein [Okeania sp. SIO3I5]
MYKPLLQESVKNVDQSIFKQELMRKASEIAVVPRSEGDSPGLNLLDIIRQSKIISQVIAFMWYYSGDEVDSCDEKNCDDKCNNNFDNLICKKCQAKLGLNWYLYPSDRNNSYPELRKLLTEGKPNKNGNKYDKFLYTVFYHLIGEDGNIKREYSDFYKFPIYQTDDSFEAIFEVDYTVFNGVISDIRNRSGKLELLFTLSFPPRPQYSNATLKPDQLVEWHENVDENDFTPPNPFIPVCCS